MNTEPDPNTHTLKSWPSLFEEAAVGRKKFELRRNDRNFEIGDILLLREFEPDTETYTGREKRFKVTYITSQSSPCALSNEALGDGYVILSIEPIQRCSNEHA